MTCGGSSMNQIVSVALYERDPGGSVLMAWAYPSLDADADAIISKRVPWSPVGTKAAGQVTASSFVFSRYSSTWHYIATFPAGPATVDIESFAIVVTSRLFHPKRYAALVKVLGDRYQSTGDPIQLLEVFLAVFTTGQYSGPTGSFSAASFVDGHALLGPLTIKALINTFGMEAVLLWDGMLQKKRILVLSDSLINLLPTIRAFPQFVWHRQDWGILRPYVTGSEGELQDLASSGVYVAGVLDQAIPAARKDLYDILVDTTTATITIAEGAKEDLRLGSLHKDVASLMVAAAEERTDQEVIKALALKTMEVIKQLRGSFAGGTPRELMERVEGSDIPASMHRFVINVGLAEGFTSG